MGVMHATLKKRLLAGLTNIVGGRRQMIMQIEAKIKQLVVHIRLRHKRSELQMHHIIVIQADHA